MPLQEVVMVFNFKLELLDRERYDEINSKYPMILQDNSFDVKLYVDPMSEMFFTGDDY